MQECCFVSTLDSFPNKSMGNGKEKKLAANITAKSLACLTEQEIWE